MTCSFRLFFGLTSAVFVFGCRAPQVQKAARAASTQAVHTTAYEGNAIPDPLVSLNKLFLEGYRERQAAVRTNTSPMIVADFSTLALYWHGAAETNRCIPDFYHALKAVAHVPFGIFLRVQPFAIEGDGRVPEPVVQALKDYQAQIGVAEASLAAAGFSDAQMVRQKQILRASMAYLSGVIMTGKAPRDQLVSFAREVGPLMLENANEAAAAELDMTHTAVMKWKARVPAEEWQRLVVVVRGPQMPRRMNILTQYFAKLLGEPSHNLGYPLESRRLIYAEFIPQGRDQIDLMATTFIDGDASEIFFGDRWRMSRDVLADGAEEHLRTLSFEVGAAGSGPQK